MLLRGEILRRNSTQNFFLLEFYEAILIFFLGGGTPLEKKFYDPPLAPKVYDPPLVTLAVP